MKERPGDQRLPQVNESIDCQETLLRHLQEDLPARRAVGIERYGTGLQPFNKRDVARDAYEEWLDLGTYLEQWRRERAAVFRFLNDLEMGMWPPDFAQERARELLDSMGGWERKNEQGES